MLFTDGQFIFPKDLELIDGEVTTVAAKLNVPLDGEHDSIISRATAAAGEYFLSRIQNFSGYLVGVGVNSNHVAAVLNVLSTAINRPRALLNQIPVKEPDPTRRAFIRWVRYYVLHDFYRSVYGRKIEDRFEKKMNFYDEERKNSWTTLMARGWPVILTPLARPGATHEVGSGKWSISNLSAVSGGTQASTVSYDISITWCSLPAYKSPLNQGNAESAGSAEATINVSAGNVIHIDITSLNPPNGQMPVAIGTAQGIYPPMAATHWNVYARQSTSTEKAFYLQNNTPIPVATKTYTFADAPVSSGYELNEGQAAMYDFSGNEHILWRA